MKCLTHEVFHVHFDHLFSCVLSNFLGVRPWYVSWYVTHFVVM